jgi:hypothetical protein
MEATLLGQDRPRTRGFTRGIEVLATEGYRRKACCWLIGVSNPGYVEYKNRSLSPTRMRRRRLTRLIREVRMASQ